MNEQLKALAKRVPSHWVQYNGVTVEVTEAGDCEHPKEGKNGLNLQMAISSAYKRCCMRVGKGLQCWTDNDDFYILDKVLEDKEKGKDLRNDP